MPTTGTASADTDGSGRAPLFLSVVVPTYNRRELVLRAVRSVLDQRDSMRIEIIVVDDGSTDATAAALHQHFAEDPRIRVIVTERVGASGARNTGFAAARGDFVCFLDSDDYWLAGTLAAVERVFMRFPQLAFVSVEGATLATPGRPAQQRIVAGGSPGWSHARFKHVKLVSGNIDLPGPASCALLYGNFFPAIIHGDLFYLSGLVMRSECVARAGPFNMRFRYFNDWEFFARLGLQGTGAYLAYDGFRRDTGRGDQISRGRCASAIARRHLYIVRTLRRRAATSAYAAALELALDDACYMMARGLAQSPHPRWARRYLWWCLRRGYKRLRCLALLISS